MTVERAVLTVVWMMLGCAAGNAWGWGAAGHQTVGALADGLIAETPLAAHVEMILGTDLATASVWADCAKGVANHDGTFEYTSQGHYTECAPFETTAGIAEMVAYVQRNWDACHPAVGEDACHKQYHYSDVAIEHQHYFAGEVGTSEHDIEAAITAAIIYLETGKNTPPIDFATQREALRVLVHLVGDIHQPLHVGAIYLDAQGREVDPDVHGLDRATQTRGGNLLEDGSKNLHSEWDAIDTSSNAVHLGRAGVALARAIPTSAGPAEQWPIAWADDTLKASTLVLEQLGFGVEDLSSHTWPVTLPSGYARDRNAIQRSQLIKAGGRLAQVINQVFRNNAYSTAVSADAPAAESRARLERSRARDRPGVSGHQGSGDHDDIIIPR